MPMRSIIIGKDETKSLFLFSYYIQKDEDDEDEIYTIETKHKFPKDFLEFKYIPENLIIYFNKTRRIYNSNTILKNDDYNFEECLTNFITIQNNKYPDFTHKNVFILKNG